MLLLYRESVCTAIIELPVYFLTTCSQGIHARFSHLFSWKLLSGVVGGVHSEREVIVAKLILKSWLVSLEGLSRTTVGASVFDLSLVAIVHFDHLLSVIELHLTSLKRSIINHRWGSF